MRCTTHRGVPPAPVNVAKDPKLARPNVAGFFYACSNSAPACPDRVVRWGCWFRDGRGASVSACGAGLGWIAEPGRAGMKASGAGGR